MPFTAAEDLCLDFVNSRFTDHRGGGTVHDRLQLPGFWRWLAARWDLDPTLPSADDIADLRRLRARLRRLLGGPSHLGRTQRAALAELLRAAPMFWSIVGEADRPRLILRPLAPGIPTTQAAIVASYVAIAGDARVRQCQNPGCSWLFRDTSRNGLRRWCEPRVCGNLVKVRAFRAARARVAV